MRLDPFEHGSNFWNDENEPIGADIDAHAEQRLGGAVDVEQVAIRGDDQNRIRQTVDRRLEILLGLQELPQRAFAVLLKTRRHVVEVFGQRCHFVFPLYQRAHAEITFADTPRDPTEDRERPKQTRHPGRRSEQRAGESGEPREDGDATPTLAGALGLGALLDHRILVHVQDDVGRVLDGNERREKLAKVIVLALFGRQRLVALVMLEVAGPRLPQTMRGFGLADFGDVQFLDAQLVFEAPPRQCGLLSADFGPTGHREKRSAVDALDRFFHALSGQHAPVIIIEDPARAATERHRRDPAGDDGDAERNQKWRERQEELGSQTHGCFGASPIETM